MDRIYRAFLENTLAEAAELQAKSGVLTLLPLPPHPPSGYQFEFRVPYLRRLAEGTIQTDPGPVLGLIRFPEDYLRSTDPKLYMKVVAVQNPDLVHPNVQDGCVCLGAGFAPGTPISALVWELFEIVTYRNRTVDERNALNPEACRLVRAHPGLVDGLERPRLFRPRRKIRLTVKSL